MRRNVCWVKTGLHGNFRASHSIPVRTFSFRWLWSRRLLPVNANDYCEWFLTYDDKKGIERGIKTAKLIRLISKLLFIYYDVVWVRLLMFVYFRLKSTSSILSLSMALFSPISSIRSVSRSSTWFCRNSADKSANKSQNTVESRFFAK